MPDLCFTDICDWETSLVLGDRSVEINFWKVLAENYGENILELGAGTGCFTIPLLQKGCNISALDISDNALHYLQKKAALYKDRGELQVFKADMRDFHLNEKFSVCMASYSTFQYLTCLQDQLHCLKTIHEHLLINGVLCLDLDNDLLYSPQYYPFTKLYSEYNQQFQAQITLYTSWDTDRKNNQRNWHDYYQMAYKDGTKTDFINDISLKAISFKEINELLTSTGFKIVDVYGDYDYSMLKTASPRMIIIAQAF